MKVMAAVTAPVFAWGDVGIAQAGLDGLADSLQMCSLGAG